MFRFQSSSEPEDLYIKKAPGELEMQDVFFDRLAEKQAGTGIPDQRLEVPLSRKVLFGLYFGFLTLVGVFLFQTFQFQVMEGKDYTALAERNTVRSTPILADRGLIYDNSLERLAVNEPSFDLVCDKRDMPESYRLKEDILFSISGAVGIDYEELRVVFDEHTKPKVVVAKGLSHEELVLVEARLSEFEGCEVQENARRRYPDGDMFSHLIGYTAKVSLDELRGEGNYAVVEQIGKSGVEKSYETVLRGTPGQIVIEKDSFGVEMQEVGELAPEAGEGLVLWVDRGLQEEIPRSMSQIYNDLGVKKGTAVALDPRTGGVLALVSMPNFDTNALSQGISSRGWNDLTSDPLSPMFNRAISGLGYPTGSVIKPIVGIAALEEGIIEEHTSIFAPLEICKTNIYTEEDECFRDWTFHGASDIRRAIAESVNTFFYIIGGGFEGRVGLGPYVIKEYLQLFGWGEATGIDIPGEGKGVLPELGAQWRLRDTYHFSIGQGPFAIPPVQVAKAFSAIANGGTLYTPQVAQRTIDNSGETLHIFEPKIERENIVNAETLQIIRSGMRQTVRNGSASGWLNRVDVSSGAKTGTAQTGRKTRDGRDYLHSWTVAFAPYEDPEIVLVVMVEDLQEGQVGTLPIAQDVFQWYFAR